MFYCVVLFISRCLKSVVMSVILKYSPSNSWKALCSYNNEFLVYVFKNLSYTYKTGNYYPSTVNYECLYVPKLYYAVGRGGGIMALDPQIYGGSLSSNLVLPGGQECCSCFTRSSNSKVDQIFHCFYAFFDLLNVHHYS